MTQVQSATSEDAQTVLNSLPVGRSVSLDHAAQLLSVSRRTIYNRIRDGQLATVRAGGSQRVLVESLQALARLTLVLLAVVLGFGSTDAAAQGRRVRLSEDLSGNRWTVDTPEDYELVRRIYDRLGRDDFGWREALAVVEANPGWSDLNRHVEQKVVPGA